MAKAQPKTMVVPRVDPDEDFSDVDGDPRTEFALDADTEDPTRHYHWAHKDADDIGSYKGSVLQYRVEHKTVDGVKPVMATEIPLGEVITKRDHILMSCDKAMWDKKERFEKKKNAEMRARMFSKAQRSVTAGMRE